MPWLPWATGQEIGLFLFVAPLPKEAEAGPTAITVEGRFAKQLC
jgi:hypothetical protein